MSSSAPISNTDSAAVTSGAASAAAPTLPVRRRVRPTGRGVVQLTLAVGLFLAGSNVAAGWVLALSAMLGVSPVVSLVAVGWAAMRTRLQLGLPQSATTGPTPASLTVVAPSWALVEVADSLTGVHTAGVPTRQERSAVTFAGTTQLPRGQVKSTATSVTLLDAFGLATATLQFRTNLDLPVVPAGHHTVGLRPPAAAAAAGQDDASRPVDGGVEVSGLRPYRLGDPLRRVHWKTVARTGELKIVETTSPAGTDAVRLEVGAGLWPVRQLDAACEIVMSVVSAYLRDGVQVTVAADGRTVSAEDVAQLLVSLPPHVSAPARPLQDPPHVADNMVPTARLVPLPNTDGGDGGGLPRWRQWWQQLTSRDADQLADTTTVADEVAAAQVGLEVPGRATSTVGPADGPAEVVSALSASYL